MSIQEFDQKHVWHPFTQAKTAPTPIELVRAEGLSLYDKDGKAYWDLNSSWWAITHGHSHPRIAKALTAQAQTMQHVMFAGFTHRPGAELAKTLAASLPEALEKVFYSDNGSTAVEVGLKMAYQYWQNIGKPRGKFLALEGAYHGDTFGAMSVGATSGFVETFSDLMFDASFMPTPHTWIGDMQVEEKEQASLQWLDRYLDQHGQNTAVFIIEPLILGAGGMKMYRKSFLEEIIRRVRAFDIVVVFDEVFTGFGRTGNMFVCSDLVQQPDIICLSKGLTAGTLPLGATVANHKIWDAFYSDQTGKTLLHGHTFAGNPLACAVALENFKIFEAEQTMQRIASIAAVHEERLEKLMQHPAIVRPRQCGTVIAFDVDVGEAQYGGMTSKAIAQKFLERGLHIRPLGHTLYMVLPYCITPEQLNTVYDVIPEVIDEIAHTLGGEITHRGAAA